MNSFYADDLCTLNEFQKMIIPERKKYLDQIYGNSNIHKVYGEINIIRNKFMQINVMYFLIGNKMIPFRLFRDEINNLIGAGIKKYGITSYRDFCNNVHLVEGSKIICQIDIVDNVAEVDKGNYITFDPFTIGDNGAREVEKIYEYYNLRFRPDRIFVDEENQKALLEGNLSEECNNQLKEFEKKRDMLQSGLNDYRQESIAVILTDLQKEEDKKVCVLRKKDKEIEKLTEQIDEKEKKLNFLRQFGINLGVDNERITYEDHKKQDYEVFTVFHKMIDYAQKYLFYKEGLSYSKEILKSFYLGLQTNQLIMLMGKPGTGKTSLVRKFAEMFGFADAAIIPVQSNWGDKGDLLGYYNPIEKNYITTPFLDSLLKFASEAKKEENQKRLYFICLDEMNLAHIEYYFAEFLSVLQSDRTLRLYSKKIKDNIVRQLKLSGFCDEQKLLSQKEIVEKMNSNNMPVLERKYYLSLCEMAEMIVNIPDEVVIPSNVKFLGTLNQDATTLDISPKVLDRSYIIRINDSNGDKVEIEDNKSYDKLIFYKPLDEYVKYYCYSEKEIALKDDVFKDANEIVNFSQRLSKQTINNTNFEKWCGAIGTGDTIDLFLAATFMPKIRFYAEEDDYEDKEKKLEKLTKNYKMTNEIFEKIKTKDGIDFWRS